MQQRVAELLEVPVDAVGLKATTTEQMGFTGRREGLAAQVAVMLWPAGTGR
jgi:2-C-methyl-D-erythritol 2,4-cyclodiphosphate synthase